MALHSFDRARSWNSRINTLMQGMNRFLPTKRTVSNQQPTINTNIQNIPNPMDAYLTSTTGVKTPLTDILGLAKPVNSLQGDRDSFQSMLASRQREQDAMSRMDVFALKRQLMTQRIQSLMDTLRGNTAKKRGR